MYGKKEYIYSYVYEYIQLCMGKKNPKNFL